MIEQQIAAQLEQAFSDYGFTEPSVAKLQKASGVSLRTLYRYYPSKESMVIGALQHRHARYIELLSAEQTTTRKDSLLAIFSQLEQWMQTQAPTGCMSMSALAAYPDNTLISEAVKQHKHDLLALFVTLCGDEALAMQIFLLHEGLSAAWPVTGASSFEAAQLTLEQLLGN
ncbi:TetR/AcrR family transcriptional regulator [Agarivorans aestuarii]|uniref:TetR/AcrR family transcriptional regulator n=1 Tax=Agarivorans aestuarii TaxID=1563703 RepID=A0ABU7G5E9_9ALTE|nr:TetR/AcrR family transcriptional regulator [Agarivorans aestuarii]MEE1674379.1 TetR/AcrR family transcriptional regulator [Agarivorans aestuarii]